jgi:gliding motility-associated-like protein
MKTLLFFGMMCFGSLSLCAQQFEKKFELALPDSVNEQELAWTDLDNDGLLDITLIGTAGSGNFFFLTYKSDTLRGLSWKTALYTELKNAAYLIADTDLDNDMDIIVSGNVRGLDTTYVFVNMENFSFVPQPFAERAGSMLRMADLNLDGKAELIMSGVRSGQSFLEIYTRNKTGWLLMHDSLKVHASAIEIFDFDRDGDNDFFVSGRNADSTILSTVFYNKGNFYFTPLKLNLHVEGRTSLADFNHDGNFDILLAGKNNISENATTLLLNQGKSFLIKDTVLTTLTDNEVFAADLNSNGQCDIHFLGYNSTGAYINTISDDKGIYHPLPIADLKAQAFGDFDRDGDLDLVQSISPSTGKLLIIYLNATLLKNEPPGGPFNAMAASIFNRLLLYWEKPLDDHTPTVSLTFDVALQTAFEEWITPEFDMLSNKRLVVSRGNNGNKNYLLLKSPPSQGINFTVQSVDNAFHTVGGGGGVCKGSGSPLCEEMKLITLEACANEQITLSANKPALWFSFADGFLGSSATLNSQPLKGDTIFSLIPPAGKHCASINVYAVKLPATMVKKINELRYVCEGQQLKLGVEPGWKQVAWGSASKGPLSNKDSIVFTALQNDTVKVKLSNGTQCFVQRSTTLIISKPELIVDGETFQILKGQRVTLNAHGHGSFLWSPSTGLDQNNIAAPVASPLQTTEYTVTLTDSLGCMAIAKVLVMVESTAFVPNLFTPNEDGKNDDVRIYGLSPVKSFSFTIHNREGSVVYETQDSHEATAIGWNGTNKGTLQPSGVYYWKIKGELASGKRLLLNGKTSGSIVLIR